MRISLILILSLASLPIFASERIDFKARIFIDGDYLGPYYQKDSDENTDYRAHVELASLKSTLKYKLTSNLQTKLQIEYKKESEEDYKDKFQIDDFYLKYDINDTSSLRFGHFKEPMGHERLMGSSSLPAIERSIVTNAFAPGRNPGIAYEFGNQSTSFHIGYFKIADDDFKNGIATTLRSTYGGSIGDHLFHIGASISNRDFDDSSFQIKERGEVNSADNIIRSARYNSNGQNIFQGELGWLINDIWIMSEYYQTEVQQTAADKWQYQGFYFQFSSLLNFSKIIKKDNYQYKNGEFDKRKAKAGDIEWVIRYSGLSLRDLNYSKSEEIGAVASSVLLGLNYQLRKNISVMSDILFPDISGNVVNTNQEGYALSFRLKYEI